MNIKTTVTGITTVIVCLILAVTILVPIATSGEEIARETTVLNGDRGNTYIPAKDGSSLEIKRTVTDSGSIDEIFSNGQPYVSMTQTWDVAIASDGIYATINDPNNLSAGAWCAMSGSTTRYNYISLGSNTSVGSYVSITAIFTDSEVNVVRTVYNSTADSTTTTEYGPYSYTWAYILSNNLSGSDVMYSTSSSSTGSAHVNDAGSTILCGLYITGTLNTAYFRYVGEDLVVLNTAYTGSVDYSLTSLEGYTDIYSETVKVTISDSSTSESFNPYRILVPYEVSGHLESTATSTIVGVIPILALVGLVIGVAGMMVFRRD